MRMRPFPFLFQPQSGLQRPQLMRFRAFNLNLPLGSVWAWLNLLCIKAKVVGIISRVLHTHIHSRLKQILNTLKLTFEAESNE